LPIRTSIGQLVGPAEIHFKREVIQYKTCSKEVAILCNVANEDAPLPNFLISRTIRVQPAQPDVSWISVSWINLKFELSGSNSKNSVQNGVEPAQPNFFSKIWLSRLNSFSSVQFIPIHF